MSLIFSSIVVARYPVPSSSGREPSGEPTFEEEATNGETATSVPSLAPAMRTGGKQQNLGCRHLDKAKPEALVNEKNSARWNRKWFLSQDGYGSSSLDLLIFSSLLFHLLSSLFASLSSCLVFVFSLSLCER